MNSQFSNSKSQLHVQFNSIFNSNIQFIFFVTHFGINFTRNPLNIGIVINHSWPHRERERERPKLLKWSSFEWWIVEGPSYRIFSPSRCRPILPLSPHTRRREIDFWQWAMIRCYILIWGIFYKIPFFFFLEMNMNIGSNELSRPFSSFAGNVQLIFFLFLSHLKEWGNDKLFQIELFNI